MKILAAEFVTSAAAGGTATGIPRDGAPQVALAGRSNVGKSRLINALCRRAIARTSAAPGKTRLANVYRVTLEGLGAPGRRDVYLVDLPGYGYARGGADAARELAAVSEAYFRRRPSTSRGATLSDPEDVEGSKGRDSGPEARAPRPEPRLVLLLADSRHPGLESDLQAYEWLQSMGIEPHIVATKIDKLSRAERARNLKALGDIFRTAVLPVSAESGEGLDELWRLISKATRAAG